MVGKEKKGKNVVGWRFSSSAFWFLMRCEGSLRISKARHANAGVVVSLDS
jgi:hypothetical protein